MKLSELFLNRFLYRDNDQNSETKGSEFVSADSSGEAVTPIASGGAANDINTGDTYINGSAIEPGTFPTVVLDVANWGWGQTCTFISVDSNTVSWGAGVFTSSDGTSYSIGSGNTGNMTEKKYIYLSLLDSETIYQITGTPSEAVGIGKVLVAVAENGATDATYMLSEAIQIVGDNILANTINASSIKTGQLIVGTNVGLGTALGDGDAASDVNSNFTYIIGGRIRTGNIESTGYSYTSGVYSTTGMQINLDNGVIRAKNFAIDVSGNAYMTGSITAGSGKIGGWSISTTSMYTGTEDHSGYTTNAGDITIYSNGSDASIHANKFYIDTAGKIFATDVTLTGSITATSGSISGSLVSSGISADNITAGTLSGRTVKTSTNNQRVELVSDTIKFYADNVPKATLEGTSAGNGGVSSTGDFYLAKGKSYWIKSSTGGANEYGGIGVDTNDHLILTCGTADDIFIKNNTGTNLVYIKDNSQAIFYDGINSEGNFNVGSSYTSRFEGGAVYFRSGTYTDAKIQGSSTEMAYVSPSDHTFYSGGTDYADAIIDNNIWSNGSLYADGNLDVDGDVDAGGNLDVDGDVDAGGTKNFLIPHPGGSDRLLRYTAQESPEVILRHRGKAKTDSTGKCIITLPNHYTLVTESKGDVTVNLTPIGNNHLFLQEEPTNAEIKVGSDNPNVSFHYEVMAIRKGYLNSLVEIDMNDKNLEERDAKLVKSKKEKRLKTIKNQKKVI